MRVTTVAHLRQAILEALTTDRTGTHPRALPADRLFQVGLPPGLPAQMRSVRALPKPGVFVIAARQSTAPGVADELSNEHQYVFGIVISRDYHVGFHSSEADIQETFTRVNDDFMRIRAALCYPGALDRTAAGDPTGIADTGLIATGADSQIRFEEMATPTQGRLLNARDSFTCRVLFDPRGADVPAPVFVRLPSIHVADAAEPVVGGALIADPGEATGAHTLRGQWLRDGDEIEGETGVSYTVVGADAGASITYRATAVGNGGISSAESNAVTVGNGGPAPLDYKDFTLFGDAHIDDDGNLVLPTLGSYASMPMDRVDPRFYSDGGGWEVDVWPAFSSDWLLAQTGTLAVQPIINWRDPVISGARGGVAFEARSIGGILAPRLLFLQANGSIALTRGVSLPQEINQKWSEHQKITITMGVYRRGIDYFEQSSAPNPPANGMHRFTVSGMTEGDGAWISVNAQPHFRGEDLLIGHTFSGHGFTGKVSPLRYSPGGATS